MSKAKPTHFAQTLADFLFSYLPDQRGLSENTIASYSDAIALFLTFCECELHIRREKITIEDLSMPLVEKYLNWLESSRHCSVSTRNQRQAALNSFFGRCGPGAFNGGSHIAAAGRRSDRCKQQAEQCAENEQSSALQNFHHKLFPLPFQHEYDRQDILLGNGLRDGADNGIIRERQFSVFRNRPR